MLVLSFPAQAKAFSGSVERWRGLASQYDWNVNQALAVMTKESGGRPEAVGGARTRYPSCGLMQVRALPGRPSCNQLKDPNTNMQWAYRIYKARHSWCPWSVSKRLGLCHR